MKTDELQALKGAFSDTLKNALAGLRTEVRKGEFDLQGNDENGEPVTEAGRILVKKSAECSPVEKEFRSFNDDCLIVAAMTRKQGESLEGRVRTLKRFQAGIRTFRQRTELQKAMTAAGATQGAEWVPTLMSQEVVELMRLELKVANLFMNITIPMGTGSFDVPAIRARAAVKLGTEITAPTGTKVTTGKITLAPKKLIAYIPYSDELEEDAAFALLPVIKQEMAMSIADSLENATINGDDSGSHMDSDVTDAEDPRKAWKGLRKKVLTASKSDLSTFTYDALVALKKKMKNFGVNPAKLALITGYQGSSKLETLKDASNNPVFLNRRLDNDPWVQGAVGIAMGMPVIVSEFVRDDLDATGVHSGTADAKSILLIVRRDGFLYGNKGTIKVESERIVKTQSTDLVSAMRVAFSDRLDAANNPIVAMGYNIA